MNYLSVCSGIEAATVAWHPLGWSPVAFAEIEKFPSAVLAHHYPSVPNLGDMTKFKDWPDADINVFVGGTPCQSFSVAGLRKGLADPRGNLALTYLAILDRYQPEWCVWENVPGVLSSGDGRDFGAFLGGLAELGYHGSYRVLDAQYVRVDGFGRAVPQRRRRVFVVGNLRDWRRSAAVLFERESMSGNPAPRRETGQGTSADVAPSIVSSGRGVERAGDTRGQDPVIAVCAAVAPTLNAHFGDKQGLEDQHVNGGMGLFVAHSLRGEGFDASEDGTGRGTPLVPIAFDCKASGQSGFGVGDIASTMRAMGHANSHTNGGGHQAVAFVQNQRDEVRLMNVAGALASEPGMKQQTYIQQSWAVRRLTPRECERLQGFPDGYTDVPWRNKNWTPDGPRYKALGNSMAVNAMRWLGRRIEMVSALSDSSHVPNTQGE
jgi:DNA (cytosine-5)-methyltransferase 1